MPDAEPTIEELQKAYSAAVRELHRTKSALIAARRAALPFKEYEVVEVQWDWQGPWSPALIRRVDVHADGEAVYYGAKPTKSGGWSKVVQYIGYGSTHLRKVQP